MYLSRMFLNPQRRGTRKLLASPEAMHAAVLSAFPPNSELVSEAGRVLWRVDREGHSLALYVVSPEEPSFEHLQQQAGWENQESWAIRDYGPVLDGISVGKRFRFRLAANPVKSVHNPQTGKSKRLAHVTAAQQRSWLLDRADVMGVRLLPADFSRTVSDDANNEDLAVSVTAREVMKFRRNRRMITIARAQFDGIVEVTDADKFRQILTHGIGKAKGYGCGLLTVAPMSSNRN